MSPASTSYGPWPQTYPEVRSASDSEPPLPTSGRSSDASPVPNKREETSTAAKKTTTETTAAATYPAEPPPNMAATPVNETIAPNAVTTATTANLMEEN